MIVDRRDLEKLLERLSREARDPRAGVFGPESMLWRINRESIAFLGGGRAALLQLAHPYVAHAIEQHSQTKSDLLGRFVRTFDNMFALVFGDLDSALRSARRVHAYHGTIKGQIDEDVGPFARGHAYAANTLPALLWVQATLIHTSVQVFELVIRPLSRWEKDAYYEDSKKFGFLFAIPEDAAPPDWPAFERYVEDMFAPGSPIVVGRPAREMAHFLMQPPKPGMGPFMSWYSTMTAALLPERIRDEYGLHVGERERAVFRGSIETLRRVYPRLPAPVRYLPAYNDALRRIAAERPTSLERLISGVWDRLARANRPHPRDRGHGKPGHAATPST